MIQGRSRTVRRCKMVACHHLVHCELCDHAYHPSLIEGVRCVRGEENKKSRGRKRSSRRPRRRPQKEGKKGLSMVKVDGRNIDHLLVAFPHLFVLRPG
jgi:hypothetical protein